MSSIDTAVLGLIQGLTEFLPVSSSGHLALAQIFIGMEMPPLSFDLVLHVATSCATIVFFWRDLWNTLFSWIRGFFDCDYRRSSGWRLGWSVILGTAMTCVIGLPIKGYAEAALQNSLSVGLGLCFTGVILSLSVFVRSGLGRVNIKDGFFVGLAQGVAIWPGISRSGMTIMTGQLSGLDKEEAFKFSFFLALPAVFGSTLFESMEVGGWKVFVASLPELWYVGAAVSFFSGLLALMILKKMVISSKWWLFGVYCLFAGISTVIISYAGVW